MSAALQVEPGPRFRQRPQVELHEGRGAGLDLDPLDTLERVARGLGVQVADLLAGDPPDRVSDEGLSPGARGVAVLLDGQPDEVVEKARKIVEVLVGRA